MRSIGKMLLSGHVADSVARILPDNPILRGGAATLAARWAMRSIPAALTLVAAGAAYRHFIADRKPANPQRKRTSGGSAKRPSRKQTAAAA